MCIISAPSILSAVYLDPRYKVLLTVNQKEKACKHLTELWTRLRSQSINSRGSASGIAIESADSPAYAASAAVNEVEVHGGGGGHSSLSELLKAKKRSHLCQIMCADDEHALQRVDLLPQQNDLSISSLNFWYRQKPVEPNLYKLACVVNACAPTQTSVERSFLVWHLF